MIKNTEIIKLEAGESIKIILHRHWFILVQYFILLCVFFVSISILWIYGKEITDLIGGPIYWGGLTLYIIFFLTYILITWINDELDSLIITDKRIININQRGFLDRQRIECSLRSIQEVSGTCSGIFQTLFQYGKIHIQTASKGTDIFLKYAPDPIKTTEKINQIIEIQRKENI